MSEKSKILLFFITIIFAGTILAVVALLSTDTSTKNPIKTPDSFPIKDSEGNVIDIGGEDIDSYSYVGITDDDTIRIYKADGTSLGVNLERNGWQDLKISEDPNVISVVGNRTTSNKDLGLYFLDTGRFGWYTDYGDQPTGILQYGWLDKETVYFHQGAAGDEWFHTFEYPSQVQIKKIFRSSGLISSLNSDMSQILYNYRGEFQTYNLLGDRLWTMNDLKDQDKKVVSTIESPLFTKSTNKVVFTSPSANGVSIYKVNSGEKEAVKLSLEFSNFRPICSVSENKIVGLRVDKQGQNEILFINVKDETLDLTVNVADASEEVVISSFDCISEDHLLFKTFKEDGSSLWYEYSGDELTLLSFLANHKEAKVINSVTKL